MNPEDVEKYMDKLYPLPHVEYDRKDKRISTQQKEETDEKPEEPKGDSSGRPGPDDACSPRIALYGSLRQIFYRYQTRKNQILANRNWARRLS